MTQFGRYLGSTTINKAASHLTSGTIRIGRRFSRAKSRFGLPRPRPRPNSLAQRQQSYISKDVATTDNRPNGKPGTSQKRKKDNSLTRKDYLRLRLPIRSDNIELLPRILTDPENPLDPIIFLHDTNHTVARPLSETSSELMRIRAVWPFDFFRSEVIVQEKKVIINNRLFFWDNIVTTLVIVNLSFTEISRSLFFASLTLHDNFGVTSPAVKWLRPKDAILAKEVIDGLIMKEKGHIELREYNIDRRVSILRELGKANVSV